MDIIIHSDGFSLTESMRTAVEQKIGRVRQYAPSAIRARVWLRRLSAHASGEQYSVGVLFELPGNDLRAEETGPDPTTALDILSEKIESRLRKRKTNSLARRLAMEGRD